MEMVFFEGYFYVSKRNQYWISSYLNFKECKQEFTYSLKEFFFVGKLSNLLPRSKNKKESEG